MSIERRLLVMRHAKSSWKSDAKNDHDRPLNKRGRRDAPRIAARLFELGWAPRRVVSSTSVRTRQTWAGMSDHFPEATVDFSEELYLSDADDALSCLLALPDDATAVLLLGHNPGFEDLVDELAGTSHRFTTANVALFRGAGRSWKETVDAGLSLVELLRPKEL